MSDNLRHLLLAKTPSGKEAIRYIEFYEKELATDLIAGNPPPVEVLHYMKVPQLMMLILYLGIPKPFQSSGRILRNKNLSVNKWK